VGVVRVGADEEGAGDSMPGRALDTSAAVVLARRKHFDTTWTQ